MTTLANDELKALQSDVQQILGQVILRLQQYERLAKAIVASHRISGSAHSLSTNQDKRIADTSGKTLGNLVNDLLGSYVRTSKMRSAEEEAAISPEEVNSISTRLGMEVSDEDYLRITNELKELVSLRNNLVHHFIDQHDLWSVEGCRGAQDVLVAASNNIGQHFEQLQDWADEMLEIRRQGAAFMQSAEGREFFINGIAPDGTVHWSNAGIVRALRRAARDLAIDGWTCLAAASGRILEQEPDQSPAKYGCSSWRQVVHESRIFELRKFEMDGRHSARYREK